jgi:ferredoxin-NADP reductase
MIDDPAGVFTLHKDALRPAVFLAGGIGITPFLSMLRQATHVGPSYELYLFYSNRRPEDAAFLQELFGLQCRYPKFTLVPTMTQLGRSERKWKGETGYIGAALIARYVGSVIGPIYYMAGPPSMIEGMRQKLLQRGVRRDDINADSFDGY